MRYKHRSRATSPRWMLAPLIGALASIISLVGAAHAQTAEPTPEELLAQAVEQAANSDDAEPLALGQALREAARVADESTDDAALQAPGSDLVLPYASDQVELDNTPSLFSDGNLRMSAKLVRETPTLEQGLTWRVFARRPDDTGTLPLIATATGGSTAFDLEPGSYLIHVAYGRAGATMRVDLGESERFETLILDAGGLRLDGAAGRRSGDQLEGLTFDIYQRNVGGSADRKLIASGVGPGKIVPLKAGPYHVVSKYGEINAVVRADVTVSPNQLTEMTAYHLAARLNFRLVTTEGGDALANTVWSILTPGGDTVAESVGAVPDFVLAEGDYVAVAQHNENVFNRSFSVEAGFDRSVEVVAIVPPSELTVRQDEAVDPSQAPAQDQSTVTFEQIDTTE